MFQSIKICLCGRGVIVDYPNFNRTLSFTGYITVKSFLRTLFSPILVLFESGNESFLYKASHRTILLFMSVLFSGLATVVFLLMPEGDPGYWFPVVIFGGVGIVGFVVGLLGNDRAVAKLWGSRE